jgi:uncharacterized repeat protein (TIGR01451 family)
MLARLFTAVSVLCAPHVNLLAVVFHPDRGAWPPAGSVQLQSTRPAPPPAPVRLLSGSFVGCGEPAANLALARSAQPVAGRIHVILQFDQIPGESQRRALAAAGVTLLDYLPDRAFFASVPAGWGQADCQAAGVRWLGAVYTEDKLAPRLNAGDVGPWALHPEGTADLRVKLFADVPLAAARAALESVGATVQDQSASGWLTINLPTTRIRDVAQLDGVRWIEEVPPPACALVDNVRTNTQAELTQEPPYGLSGAGVTVGVWDIGLVDSSHADFAGRILIMDTNSTQGVQPHATHVAGIVGGSGSLSASLGGYPFQWRGLAPSARLISWDNVNEIAECNAAINSLGVTVSQNSWGVSINGFYGNCSVFGDYSYDAPSYDAVINGSLYGGRMNVVFAAGNARNPTQQGNPGYGCNLGPYGTVGPPATAKDAIAVGAINSNDNSMTYFSSWGPVDDGRLKPDLVAPGARIGGENGVTSTLPGNTYGVLSGTSMAAPAVSGAIALLTEDYHRRFNGQNPLPALMKALLLHTAQDLNDGSATLTPGPDFASGYGRLQVKAAVDQLESGGELVGRIGNSKTNFYRLPVAAGVTQVKITLAWDDAPGAENAAVALVNDLDLVVVDPSGTRHYPWTLDPANPQNAATRDREDHLNVVEQVQVDTNDIVPGDWTVEVVGHQVPAGPQQSYALVFTPATMAVPPGLQLDHATFDDTEAGNGNGAVDPGETISELVALANQDGPAATGVQATLSALTPDVVVLQAVSTYPDIPPGVTATNATAFVYRVPKTIACGSAVMLQQVVTTTNGFTFTNYINHLVGAYGVTNLATNVFDNLNGPQGIPDGGSLTSSLPVAVFGQVRRVTASVRINHPADEDLLISLVSPDGTRVPLVGTNSYSQPIFGVNMGIGTCDDTGQPTIFDDAAATDIRAGVAPYAGTYRPDGALSNLVDHELVGNWQLVVSDVAIGDTGSLICWGIEVAYAQSGYTCQLFNRPPAAQPQSVDVIHDFPAQVRLTGNDPDDDPLTFAIVDFPQHGVVALDTATGEATYQPTPGYTGPDSFTFSVNDGLTDSPPAVVNLEVAPPQADLALLAAAPARVMLGSNVVVSLTVTNAGPNPASGVILTDMPPAGADIVSVQFSQGQFTNGNAGLVFAFGDLPAGSSASAQIVVMPATIGAVTNQASVVATESDPNFTNNSATTISLVNRVADLALMSVALPAKALLSDTFTVQLTLTNQGPSAATGIRIVDLLPAEVQVVSVVPSQGDATPTNQSVFCDLGSVDVGGSAVVVLTLQPSALGTLTNVAVATANEFNFAPDDAAATSVVEVLPAANLAVQAAVSRSPAVLGYPLAYTISVTNQGPNPATGIVLTNELPPNATLLSVSPALTNWVATNGVLTLLLGDLPVGTNVVVEVQVQPASLDPLTNMVSAGAAETDPDLSDNTVVLVTPVLPVANLAVTSLSPLTPVAFGVPLTLTFDITNRGPSDASAVVLSDPLPTNLEFVSATASRGTNTVQDGVFVANLGALPVGTNATVTLTVTPTSLATITNVVSVQAAELNLAPDGASVTNVIEVDSAADLVLSVAVSPAPVVLNGPMTYQIVVTNQGPDTATTVVVQDQLPPEFAVTSITTSQGTNQIDGGTLWLQFGDVPAGGIATALIAGTANAAGTLENIATATADQVDVNPADNCVTTNTKVFPEAELTLLPAPLETAVHFGDSVTVGLTVTNAGPDTASSVAVADALPAGFELVSASASQGGYTMTNGAVLFDLGALSNQTSAVVTLVVRPRQLGGFTNLVSVSAPEVDLHPDDNVVAQVGNVSPQADLALAADVDLPAVAVGANFTATFTVTNAGPNAASAVTLTGSLPDALELISITTNAGPVTVLTGAFVVDLGMMDVGATAAVQVTASYPIPATLLLTGAVQAAEYDGNLTNNAAVLSVRALPQADLGITKAIVSSVPDAGILLGQPVTYSLTVTNGGPATAPNVRITDPLPASLQFINGHTSQGSLTNDQGIVYFDLGDLDVGASATVFLVAAPQIDGTVTNTAFVSADVLDPLPDNDAAAAVLRVRPSANLAVTQTITPNPGAAGEPLTIQLVVTNAGPGAATGVQLTDTLAGTLSLLDATNSQGTLLMTNNDVTCLLGDLAAGGTARVTVRLRPNAVGSFDNTAVVAANEIDPDLSDNLSMANIEVKLAADLAIGMTANAPTVPVGGQFTYSILVTNLGPNAADNIFLTDVLPPGLTLVTNSISQGSLSFASGAVAAQLGSLDVGAVATLDLVVASTEIGQMTNSVSVDADETDLNRANNTAAVVTDVRYDAELTLTATNSPAEVLVGNTVTWHLVVTNAGPHDASAVTISTTLPAGVQLAGVSPDATITTNDNGALLMGLGSLPAGATITVTVSGLTTLPGVMTNTFTVSSDELDSAPADNTASTITLVDAAADLAVSAQWPDAPVVIGHAFTLSLLVTNQGPSAASDVIVTNALPAALTLVSAQPSQGTNWLQDGVLICDLGPLAASNAATVVLALLPVQVGPFTNTAIVTAPEADPDGTNNLAVSTVTVLDEANLGLALQAPAAAQPLGGQFTYALTLTNQGPGTATIIGVTNTLPPGVAFVSADADAGTAQFADGVVLWQLDSLAAQTNAMLTITVSAQAVGWLTNTAVVGAAESDLSTNDNTAAVGVLVQPQANLTLLADAPGLTYLGAQITCYFQVTNEGPDDAPNVVLTNLLPPGLTNFVAEPSQGTNMIGPDTLVWTVGTLPAGGNASLTVTANTTALGWLTNAAAVTAEVVDTNLDDNLASAVVDVLPQAKLVLQQTASTNIVLLNGQVNYTFQLTNVSTVTAPKVQLLAAFTFNADILSASSTVGRAEVQPPGVICALGDLAPGAGAQITIVVQALSVGEIVCQTTAYSPATDPTDPDLSGRLVAEVVASPQLWVDQTSNRLVFSWPVTGTNFVLESATTLTNPKWTPVNYPTVIAGDQITVTLKPIGTQSYFRLHQP